MARVRANQASSAFVHVYPRVTSQNFALIACDRVSIDFYSLRCPVPDFKMSDSASATPHQHHHRRTGFDNEWLKKTSVAGQNRR